MERQVLEKAIKIHKSIENIDVIFEYLEEHESASLQIRDGCEVYAPFRIFSKSVQEFVIDALRDYRSRLEDELDKL